MERETRKEREGMEKTRKDGKFGSRSGFAWLFSVDGIRGLARKLFAVMIAFTCVGMWGCADDVDFSWSKNRSIGGIVGFVDDSLAIVSSYHYWHEEVEPALSLSYSREGRARPGLSLYNYRVQLDGPVWTDTLDNSEDDEFEYIVGQLSDSVVWGGNGNNSFSFWKLGEKPIIHNVNVTFDGCENSFELNRMRTWLNEKIFMQGPTNAGGDSCQYAILDTVAGTLTYKRLDDELKWIEKCDDVRAWGEDVYCLYYDVEFSNVYLKVNSNLKDSMAIENQSWYSGVFFEGHLMLVDGNLCDYKNAWECYPRRGVLKIGFHAANGVILQF